MRILNLLFTIVAVLLLVGFIGIMAKAVDDAEGRMQHKVEVARWAMIRWLRRQQWWKNYTWHRAMRLWGAQVTRPDHKHDPAVCPLCRWGDVYGGD